MVLFQSHGQKKDAIHLVNADQMFETFDGLIQRASLLISRDTQNEKIGEESVVNGDESLVKKKEEDGSNGLTIWQDNIDPDAMTYEINGSLARRAIKDLMAKGLIRMIFAHASQQIYTRATNT